ncbi:MAG TPA: dTDP-4-dehydrorhamnose 3,5-epimerase [Actinomycetota bacterium]|nr:dTDP-4-dehydrorhamnose 3,5-epimerase [Actinomycetota bacterium]
MRRSLREIPIEGLIHRDLVAHEDGRGSVSEIFRQEWLPGASMMIQSNVSRSHAGVLRGLHVHREQADYWVVLAGSAFVGLADLRSGSPTESRSASIRLDAQTGSALYIPPGVAHGYYAETDVLLQYLVDRPYTGDDEFGVAWDDPELGIGWPDRSPTLSERDRSNPGLSEVRASLDLRFER